MGWRVYPLVGKTFMPTMDEGDIIIGIEKLPSISLEQTAALDLMGRGGPDPSALAADAVLQVIEAKRGG